jgi:hypothetical protein
MEEEDLEFENEIESSKYIFYLKMNKNYLI